MSKSRNWRPVAPSVTCAGATESTDESSLTRVSVAIETPSLAPAGDESLTRKLSVGCLGTVGEDVDAFATFTISPGSR